MLIEGDDHGAHLFVDANEDELDTLIFLDRRTFAAKGVFRRHGDRWVRDQPHEARWSAALDETLVGPASRERWRRWLEQGGERPWEGPRPSSLSRGQLEDLDRDGRVDSLITVDRDVRYDVLWEVTAVDVDQAWPVRERVDERLRAPRSGIDFVIFASPGNFFRAWYDRDGDRTFETVLDASADGTVTRAELRREGAIELRDELVGTLVGRPDFARTERDRARALLEEIVGPHRIHHDAGVDLWLLRDDDQLYFDGSDLPTGVFRGESLFGTVYAFDLEGDAVTEPQPDLVDDAEAWSSLEARSRESLWTSTATVDRSCRTSGWCRTPASRGAGRRRASENDTSAASRCATRSSISRRSAPRDFARRFKRSCTRWARCSVMIEAMRNDAKQNAFCIATDATGFKVQPPKAGEKKRKPRSRSPLTGHRPRRARYAWRRRAPRRLRRTRAHRCVA